MSSYLAIGYLGVSMETVETPLDPPLTICTSKEAYIWFSLQVDLKEKGGKFLGQSLFSRMDYSRLSHIQPQTHF